MIEQETITEAGYELQWLEAKIELACLRYEFGLARPVEEVDGQSEG